MPIPPNTLFIKKNYHSLFVARTWQHFTDLLKRKNSRFTAFLDSYLHTRLAIVTENELGLAFPVGTFQKISSRSVHVLCNYRGNKQTDRQTNAGDYIIPRESFRGDKNSTGTSAAAFSADGPCIPIHNSHAHTHCQAGVNFMQSQFKDIHNIILVVTSSPAQTPKKYSATVNGFSRAS